MLNTSAHHALGSGSLFKNIFYCRYKRLLVTPTMFLVTVQYMQNGGPVFGHASTIL